MTTDISVSRVLQIVFVVGALAAAGFTPAPMPEAVRVGCQGGATGDSAWCCACNEEYCGPVEHSGLWECDQPGVCESPPCAVVE